VAPFSNTLVLIDMTGAELLSALQAGFGKAGLLIPSRGFAYGKDGATLNGVAIDPAKTYRCCFNSFVASGGDSQVAVRDAKGTRTDTGIVDIDALVAYLRANKPVTVESVVRIKQ
jgi:5'-nucleotidase